MMIANDYQDYAMKTAVYCDAMYPFYGLAEESGEALGKIAKALRKRGFLEPEDHIGIAMELGDVLWMVAACARELEYTLEDIMIMNLVKLEDRALRGVLEGEGDNR